MSMFKDSHNKKINQSFFSSLINKFKNKAKNITLIQCDTNSDNLAFQDEINALTGKKSKSIIVYSMPLAKDVLGKDYHYKGFFTKGILEDLNVSLESDFYFCGSTTFMANISNILSDLGVKRDHIHYEFFGPSEEFKMYESYKKNIDKIG